MAVQEPPQVPDQPVTAGTAGQQPAARVTCPGCHGAGSIVMSLCCGRGCATCTGEGMMQAVECYGCQGRGYR